MYVNNIHDLNVFWSNVIHYCAYKGDLSSVLSFSRTCKKNNELAHKALPLYNPWYNLKEINASKLTPHPSIKNFNIQTIQNGNDFLNFFINKTMFYIILKDKMLTFDLEKNTTQEIPLEISSKNFYPIDDNQPETKISFQCSPLSVKQNSSYLCFPVHLGNKQNLYYPLNRNKTPFFFSITEKILLLKKNFFVIYKNKHLDFVDSSTNKKKFSFFIPNMNEKYLQCIGRKNLIIAFDQNRFIGIDYFGPGKLFEEKTTHISHVQILSEKQFAIQVDNSTYISSTENGKWLHCFQDMSLICSSASDIDKKKWNHSMGNIVLYKNNKEGLNFSIVSTVRGESISEFSFQSPGIPKLIRNRLFLERLNKESNKNNLLYNIFSQKILKEYPFNNFDKVSFGDNTITQDEKERKTNYEILSFTKKENYSGKITLLDLTTGILNEFPIKDKLPLNEKLRQNIIFSQRLGALFNCVYSFKKTDQEDTYVIDINIEMQELFNERQEPKLEIINENNENKEKPKKKKNAIKKNFNRLSILLTKTDKENREN